MLHVLVANICRLRPLPVYPNRVWYDHSLNIQVFRQLALFEPPIDPAMLARATAAGLDIRAIVNEINQPLPLVRFVFLV